MTDFILLRPYWSLLLIPLPLVLWFLHRHSPQQAGWQKVIAPHLQSLLLNSNPQSQKRTSGLIIAVWLVATIAMSGPSWRYQTADIHLTDEAGVVVVDMSLSMRATDIAPDRITRSRYKLLDLFQNVKNGELGLVTYAADAYVMAPLTSDRKTLINMVPALSPEIMPALGSRPELGVEKAIQLLTQAGQTSGDILLLTDGITLTDMRLIIDLLHNSDFSLTLYAVGTTQGAPIRLEDGELLRDRSGDIIVPKTDPDPMRRLARSVRGNFVPMTTDNSDIQQLTKLLLQVSESTEKAEETASIREDGGIYFLLILLPLALISMRRGVIITALLCLLPYSRPGIALGWDDLWQTADQQGQQAMDAGDYARAAELFADPFRKGIAQYRAGDYQASADSFAQLDSADSHYNRGNALAKMKKLDEAIEAYDEALKIQPDMQDAQKNQQIVAMMKQMQQNEKNSESGDSNHQNGQDTQSDNNQQQQSDSQQQSKQQQQSESQQSNSQSQQQQANDLQSQQQDSQSQQSDEQQRASTQPQSELDRQLAEQSEQQQQEGQAQQQQQSEQEEGEEQPVMSFSQGDELAEGDEVHEIELPPELKRLPEDPSLLLKNKMKLEYERRRANREPVREEKIW